MSINVWCGSLNPPPHPEINEDPLICVLPGVVLQMRNLQPKETKSLTLGSKHTCPPTLEGDTMCILQGGTKTFDSQGDTNFTC